MTPATDARTAPEAWEAIAPLFAEAVRGYHAVRGSDPESERVKLSVRINSELVPDRGRLLLELLDDAGVVIEGSRVMDVGSGFGALAAYLAAVARPARMTVCDLRADLLALGSACADGDPALSAILEFAVANVCDLSQWSDATFDVVVMTGVTPYLSRAELNAALAEVRRVLVPGGHVVLYQSNRWWPVDGFTGRPFIHLLPRLSDRGRVRTRSLPALRRSLRRAGLRPVLSAGFARDTRLPRALRAFGSANAVVARGAG